jgi:membrane fusion protein (multidrug efflux system)
MSNRTKWDDAELIPGAADIEVSTVDRRSRLRGPLLLAAPVVVVIALLYFYLTGGRYETTDNASLQTGQVAIAADVSGSVISVDVNENQSVRAGQVLFRLDPDKFETAVAEAAAQLAAARANVGSLRADYNENSAEVAAEEARLAYAEGEAARQKSLLAEGISSRAQYDAAVLAVKTAGEAIGAARAKAESVRATLGGKIDAPVDSQPAVQQALAAYRRARLALDDTIVRAPQDGIVTRVHQLQVGSYVTASRPVFVMAGKRFWVQANFKENQLRYMRAGQPATVRIDAFSGRELKAHIASFSPGTGNSFSLLPAENATGNWVKVVQRLPVEIALDEVPADLPLHAGLSVEVTVDTGHKRHLIGPDTPPTGGSAAPAGASAHR